MIRHRLRRQGIGQTSAPAVLIAGIGRGGVPVSHRGEVRERRLRIARAVHDGELAVLPQALHAEHARVEAEVVVELQEFVFFDGDTRAQLVIGVVGVGHDGVQSIVTARHFKHHQDALVGRAVGGQRLLKNARHGAGHQSATAEGGKTGEELATVHHDVLAQPNWYSGRLSNKCSSKRRVSSM